MPLIIPTTEVYSLQSAPFSYHVGNIPNLLTGLNF